MQNKIIALSITTMVLIAILSILFHKTEHVKEVKKPVLDLKLVSSEIIEKASTNGFSEDEVKKIVINDFSKKIDSLVCKEDFNEEDYLALIYLSNDLNILYSQIDFDKNQEYISDMNLKLSQTIAFIKDKRELIYK